ncbi:hypothetical protein ETH_00032385, partial [Eimeria tenella]
HSYRLLAAAAAGLQQQLQQQQQQKELQQQLQQQVTWCLCPLSIPLFRDDERCPRAFKEAVHRTLPRRPQRLLRGPRRRLQLLQLARCREAGQGERFARRTLPRRPQRLLRGPRRRLQLLQLARLLRRPSRHFLRGRHFRGFSAFPPGLPQQPPGDDFRAGHVAPE